MQIARQSHENYVSFVCCILSHGYFDGIYGTESQPVKVNDIAGLFKESSYLTLSNKPKWFFIQAYDEDKHSENTHYNPYQERLISCLLCCSTT